MTISSTNLEFELLRNLICNECGIFLKENKKYLIENRLSRLALNSGCRSFAEFYRKITESPHGSELRDEVINAITTQETLWLRDSHPFKILSDQVFPYYEQKIQNARKKEITIWSAACSTGQEPYSIVMTAMDYNKKSGVTLESIERLKVLATDISTKALQTAKEGRYDKTAIMRGMPDHYLADYFDKSEDHYIIKDIIKKRVTFRQFNLKYPASGLFGPFDIIFLRNVIIYFSDDFKKALMERVAQMLKPDGHLFLGTGECVEGYSEKFICIEECGSVYYRLKCG